MLIPSAFFYYHISLRYFRQVYPHIGIVPQQVKDEDFFRYLIYMKADIGIGVNSHIEHETDLDKQILYRDRFCVVVSDEHLLADKNSVSLSSLVDEQYLVYSREASSLYFQIVQRLCVNGGFTPTIKKEIPGTDILLTSIEIGEGIALLPRIYSKVYQSPHLRFIDIDDGDVDINYVLTWKKDHQNPLVNLFLNEIVSFQIE